MQNTSKQVARFERDGFLVLENFVQPKACESLRARAEELVRDFDPAGIVSIFSTQEQSHLRDDYFLGSGDKIRFFFEEDAFLPNGELKQSKERSINKIGHALHELDPVFSEFSKTPAIKELVDDLNIANPRLVQSMYIFKQPKIGGEVTCHQDSAFLYTKPIDIAGLWFALEDATTANGCLWAIPGGHAAGLKSRWRQGSDGAMGFEVFDPTPYPEEKLVPLEVSQGTLIVLHGLLPHKSLPNRSQKSRHAYTLHAVGGNSQYPADNWLQLAHGNSFRGFE